MPVHALKLGHAVIKVRSLERSVPFYRDVLGLKEVARYHNAMVFFTCGENHHDLGLMEVGPSAPGVHEFGVGLYHLAFKVGDSLEELRAFRDHLAAKGVPLAGQSDHRVSQSLYLHDPDGMLIECYVDADPSLWNDDPTAVAHVGPLKL
ncbi:MAG: VOC family protein [Thiobacillaceae bacterium]